MPMRCHTTIADQELMLTKTNLQITIELKRSNVKIPCFKCSIDQNFISSLPVEFPS